MKKLLLLAAVGFMANPALAQRAATPTQALPSFDAPCDAASGQCADIVQDGDFSTGTATQSGAAHRASIYTNSAAANSGEANAVTITQSSLSADIAIVQQGTDPNKTVKSTIANVVQSGAGSNEAFIEQNIQQSGNEAISEIFQDGFDNSAQTYMNANQGFGVLGDDYTRIGQSGDGNFAYQEMDNERQTRMVIEQNGADHTAYQYAEQTNDNNNRMIIVQANEAAAAGDNYAFQNGGAQGGLPANELTTIQLGSNNVAEMTSGNGNNILTIRQGEGAYTAGYFGDTDATDQTITESSDDNQAYIVASGKKNSVEVDQIGAGSNLADLVVSADAMDNGVSVDVFQDGSNNRLVGLSNTGAAQVLEGASLDVDQVGSGNHGYVFQGTGGVGVIDQAGNSNTATINQF